MRCGPFVTTLSQTNASGLHGFLYLLPVSHTNASPFLLGYEESMLFKGITESLLFIDIPVLRIALTLPRVEQMVLDVFGSAVICQIRFRSFFGGLPFLKAYVLLI